jgi:O-acetyl-ADP-ribose deacetylase (regulator of RNase III)
MKYQEVQGNLITLALEGKFDVITHGCNCFCTMGAGIAPQMAKAFGCDKFKMEQKQLCNNIDKLGCIDFERVQVKDGIILNNYHVEAKWVDIVNSYTQFHYGSKFGVPLDYEALTLCLRKINHQFKGKHIGLPKIGSGLAGGDWYKIREIIKKELNDMSVTVVIYEKS